MLQFTAYIVLPVSAMSREKDVEKVREPSQSLDCYCSPTSLQTSVIRLVYVYLIVDFRYAGTILLPHCKLPLYGYYSSNSSRIHVICFHSSTPFQTHRLCCIALCIVGPLVYFLVSLHHCGLQH